MRRPAIALLSLTILACQPAKPGGEGAPPPSQGPREPTPSEPTPSEPTLPNDLFAPKLAPVPTLETVAAAQLAAGQFSLPAGTDELAPRVALELSGGLLLAGQAYHQRRSAPPPQSWRWTGFIPGGSEGGGERGGEEPQSRLSEPGAIRAGIVSEGRALLVGTSGLGFDSRGWFGVLDGAGELVQAVTLASESSTELFQLLPGRSKGELAVVAGYVDAQGWLVALDGQGQPRWDRYLGSYGYTQVRSLARLESGELLALGSRGDGRPEAWSARAPGSGGDAGPEVVQTKIEIEGADPSRGLQLAVDLGEQGLIALGTATEQFRPAHAQLIAAGFDRSGALAWARVVEALRVVELIDGQAHAGAALVLASVPLDDSPTPATALALVSLRPSGEPAIHIVPTARHLGETEGWTSAGFVRGRGGAPEILAYRASAAGLQWRRLALPDPMH